MKKAYIDTNILVDLVLSREEWLADAQSVFALGYAGKVQLMVRAGFNSNRTAANTAEQRYSFNL